MCLGLHVTYKDHAVVIKTAKSRRDSTSVQSRQSLSGGSMVLVYLRPKPVAARRALMYSSIFTPSASKSSIHSVLIASGTEPMISAPQPLTDRHQFANFCCGEPSLDDGLMRRAVKNHANGSSRTYVVCVGEAVVGYCRLAAGAIGHADAQSPITRNRPDPIPVLVLGRLAIHKEHHSRGIGTALLNDAIQRAIQAAEIAGVTALLVHAISEPARRFYRSRGFIESPVKPMTLCLMLVTVNKALRER